MRRAPAIALALLAACGATPQQLPVAVWNCSGVSANGRFTIVAMVRNEGGKPISQLTVASDFYRDYRYSRFTAIARLRRELDPGGAAQVTFPVPAPSARPQGQALRCLVTRIRYLDGTSVSIPR